VLGRNSIALACALVVAAGLVPTSAHAAFPGRNGLIVFHTNRDAGNYEIYTMNADGSSPTRLTNSAGHDLTPKWSPDGKKIAFVSIRDGNYEIYTMDADGSNQTRITNNPAEDVQPAWSPDGTQLVFGSTRDGNEEIYTMNANGTNQVRRTTTASNVTDGFPSWSPDGTQIAFQSDRTGNFEIFTMNTNGTAQTNRTNNAAYDEYPSWYPDGSFIAFDSNRNDGNFEIYRMFPDGSNVQRETNRPADDTSGSRAPQQNFLLWVSTLNGDKEIQTSVGAITTNSVDDDFPDWQPIVGSYVRPAVGPVANVSLVPAYKQCNASEAIHRGSWNPPACYVPVPESSFLTVGTPDVNGAAANSSGSMKITVFCNGGATGEVAPCLTTAGDQLDGRIVVSMTDVRCAGTSGGCSGGPLADYTGNLRAEAAFRVTDKNNGPTGVGPSANATTQDVVLGFNVPCSTTPAGTIGASCSVTTSIDAVLGGNTAITEQKRAIWQLIGSGSDIRLLDGGPDGVAQTVGGNTLFATAGLFFP
jgi:TolB protein